MAGHDLVVVVPGILGSRLVSTEPGRAPKLLWDLRLRSLPRTLALLAGGGFAAPDPADGVVADALLTEPAWLPDFFGVDGYTAMVQRLEARLLPGQVVSFAYDWRYSNAVSAARLADEIEPVLAAWRDGAGGRDAKLVLVCHSMGGLVARYFCEALGGADLTRRVITFGTPHRGAAKALYALGGSMRLARLINARPIAEHWPSVWEMLPQYPVLRQDGGFVHLSGSSLALARDPRFVAAQTFCRAIREPAERRVREGLPSPYDQLVFAGRVQTTLQYLKLSDGAVLPIRPGAENVSDRGGDGTVPWFAAVPIEWDETADVLPLLDKHTALATREIAIEHLLNRLAPTDVSGDKAPELGPDATDLSAVGYALDVPPVVDAGESVVVRVVHPTLSAVALEVTDHERGDRRFFDEARSTGEAEARGFVLEVDLGPLPPGTYTVRTQLSPSVSDHVLVWSESLVP